MQMSVTAVRGCDPNLAIRFTKQFNNSKTFTQVLNIVLLITQSLVLIVLINILLIVDVILLSFCYINDYKYENANVKLIC